MKLQEILEVNKTGKLEGKTVKKKNLIEQTKTLHEDQNKYLNR